MTPDMYAFCLLQERLTQLREHRDVEKEFEVRTNVRQREIPQAAKVSAT